MFKSYHKVVSIAAVIALASVSAVAGDDASRTYANGKKVIDGGVTYPVKNGKTAAYYVNTQKEYKNVKFGRKATANEIKAWDIDVMPDGTGLPEGKGSVEEWVMNIKPGRIVFEVAGVPEDVARKALTLALHKLPFQCKIISAKDSNEIY